MYVISKPCVIAFLLGKQKILISLLILKSYTTLFLMVLLITEVALINYG